jgi:hypothetical protein
VLVHQVTTLPLDQFLFGCLALEDVFNWREFESLQPRRHFNHHEGESVLGEERRMLLVVAFDLFNRKGTFYWVISALMLKGEGALSGVGLPNLMLRLVIAILFYNGSCK